MSGDELDLDAIEARLDVAYLDEGDVRDLVAEVRRLRADLVEARVTIRASVGQYAPPPGYDDFECCASGSCEVCRR